MEKNEKKREKIVDYNRYYYIPVTSKFVEYKGIPFIEITDKIDHELIKRESTRIELTYGEYAINGVDKNTEKYLGNDELWVKSETALRKILKDNNLEFYEAKGEAAYARGGEKERFNRVHDRPSQSGNQPRKVLYGGRYYGRRRRCRPVRRTRFRVRPRG